MAVPCRAVRSGSCVWDLRRGLRSGLDLVSAGVLRLLCSFGPGWVLLRLSGGDGPQGVVPEVEGRVHVAVMDGPADARPVADAQRNLVPDVPATWTRSGWRGRFRARAPRCARPRRLSPGLSRTRIPHGVVNAPGHPGAAKAVMPNVSRPMTWFSSTIRRAKLVVVRPRLANLAVDGCDLWAGLLPIRGAFPAPGRFLLRRGRACASLAFRCRGAGHLLQLPSSWTITARSPRPRSIPAAACTAAARITGAGA